MASVEFYVDRRGREPAWEFLQQLPAPTQAALLRALELLEEFGTTLRAPYAKHIEGRLWELRGGAGRLFYFALINQRFVIVHGYLKKSKKAPRREIDLALSRLNEYMGRLGD